jgi:hypothetical protein
MDVKFRFGVTTLLAWRACEKRAKTVTIFQGLNYLDQYVLPPRSVIALERI